MFKIIILFFINSMLLANSNHASLHLNKCGTLSPAIDLIIEENQINNWLEENANNINRDNLNIPIAFHIIYEDFSSNGGYIEESSINSQVDVLNNAFNSTNITFSLYSINYIENSNWYNDDDEYTYKEELSITPNQILNIYTTTAGGYLGYAYFPNQWSENSYMHGVVLNSTTFPGGDWPYDQGDTAVHEVGHYLGLYHTFQDGCSENGDYISDTPSQDDGENIYYCNESLDTCDTPGTDPIHNYMNYTDDECLTEFSNGQIDRMHFMIETYKPTLGCSSGYDCAGVCDGLAIEDCLGICNGDSMVDECGICGGDGPMENMDCNGNCVVEVDCSGICGGSSSEDNCGTCDSDLSNDCIQDCSGIWGGNSDFDECGICEGNGIPEGECDCDGNIADCFGVCGGDNLSCNDCNGELYGYAYIDNCDNCVGGNTGLEPCLQDCSGEWGGNAYDQGCGCGVYNQSPTDGCDNVCGSTLEFDLCGECGGDDFDNLGYYCDNLIDECECGHIFNISYYDINNDGAIFFDEVCFNEYNNWPSCGGEDEMSIIATVLDENSNLLFDDGDYLMAYSDNYFLGGQISTILPSFSQYERAALMMIQSFENSAHTNITVNFKYFDSSLQKIITLNDTIDFINYGTIGDIFNPLILTPVCLEEDSQCQSIGDLNGDETVNVTDIILLVDWILNNNFQINGDINQDNSMNVSDVVMLIDLILND